MVLNQFALQEVSYEQLKTELNQLGFTTSLNTAVKSLWRQWLLKSMPECRTTSARLAKLANILAYPGVNLKEFLTDDTPISIETFYVVGLQLLKFTWHVDFEWNNILDKAERLGIKVIKGDYSDPVVLQKAWYNLLLTHTKFGVTLLDDLASRGFYQNLSTTKPFFINGKAQAVFDTNQLIREVVYVETDVDTDGDDCLDLIKVEIVRPGETNDGLRIPSLFTASPYNQGINREVGNKAMHDVNQLLTRKDPDDLSYEDIRFNSDQDKVMPDKREVKGESEVAEEIFGREASYALNDYFLARGFAAVYSAGIGTLDSDGIQTCGSIEQTQAMVSVIEWLNGKRRAFTNRTDQIEIKAWWSNGSVAMTGRSYLGTLATAAATTGVEGLKTIIPEAAISNWYQYYRDNGLVIAPGGYPGEDADVLAKETFSRQKAAGDYLHIKQFFDEAQGQMVRDQDRDSGSYNTFWDERNYLPHIGNIKAPVLIVHGLNDWNVKPRQAYQLWQGLKNVDVPQKIILHQGQHIYIHNMPSFDYLDIVNGWISHYLYGLENGIVDHLPDVIYQTNHFEETWEALPEWGSQRKQRYQLGHESLTVEGVVSEFSEQTFNDQLTKKEFDIYKKDAKAWLNDLYHEESPLKKHRYFAKTAPLTEAIQINGAPIVTLKVASSQNIGMLTVRLVDFKKAKRLKKNPTTISLHGLQLGYHWRDESLAEFRFDTPSDYQLISIGHLNLQNRHNPWSADELVAGEAVDVELELQPTIYRLNDGHELGLIITGTDFEYTVRGNQAIAYTISLAESSLQLPLENLTIKDSFGTLAPEFDQ